MIKKIKDFVINTNKNELVRASIILMILMILGNLLSYIFQFSMARMLGPVDYGVLAVLTSVVSIFAIPTTSIQTIVCQYTTRFSVRKQPGKIKGMLKSFINKAVTLALVCFVLFAVLSIFLSNWLQISYWLLVFTGLFVFGAFLYPINSGVIQGLKKFKELGWNFVFNCGLKLIIGILLVYFGFRVYGAVIAFILGTLAAFFLFFPNIRQILKQKAIRVEGLHLFSEESKYTFFAMLFIVLIYSLDVIFVKAFFDAELAGKYAVISMIGKMILFVNMAIATAMFPINSEKFERGDNTRSVIKKAFLLAGFISACAMILFFLFPKLIVSILFGGQYVSLANILIYSGVAFSCISFLNLIVLYKISKNSFKFRGFIVLFLFLALEIIGFLVFNKTIEQFSIALMISSITAFIGGILFLRK